MELTIRVPSLYVDSSVFLMTAGSDHPRRGASQEFVNAALAGRWRMHASVETIQEYVFHRTRRGDRATGIRQGQFLANACVIHMFDHHVLHEALRLMETSEVRGRDAVHAATALLGGFDRIVTLDSDFGSVPGLTPVTPEELLAQT